MKRLLVSLGLIFCVCEVAHAVPDTTLSITPTATSGTTITASDETSRMNAITTAYNSHSHTSIASTTANTYTVGSGLTGDKALAISNSFTTSPSVRYQQTGSRWQASNDASAFFDIPLVSNTTAGQLIRATGSAWGTTTPTFPNTGGTSGQWLRTDGTNYGLSTATIPTTAGASGTYLCSDGTNWVTCSAPVFGRALLDTGNVTTTSTTPVDLTGATVTLTTGAFPVQINWSAVAANSSTTGNAYYRVMVDGTSLMGTFGNENDTPTANRLVNVSFSLQSAALTAASHTVKIQWAVDAGTGTTLCNTQSNCILSVHEVR